METARLVFILISAFVCFTRINSLEYADLEAMGISCPSALSCVFIDSSNFTRRNCECDRSCVIYQDCCVDARVRVTSRSRVNSAFACMPFGGEPNIGAYVIQTCSRSYNGPAEMQRKCQNQNNVSDPLMAAPVTDTVSDTSYRNRYCAECNNVDISNVQSWLIQMDCDFTSTINVSNRFIWQNLQYRPNLNKWGVTINERFYTCNLNFEIPDYLLTKIRLCRSDVISSCPRTWSSRMMIKRECETYTATVYVTGSESVYRNPHCAICNGVTVNEMRCDPGVTPRKKKPFSFALLLDVNQSDGDVVGVSRPRGEVCGPNQKYDPYFKKCRNLVCALPGYQMVNGKCKKPV